MTPDQVAEAHTPREQGNITHEPKQEQHPDRGEQR